MSSSTSSANGGNGLPGTVPIIESPAIATEIINDCCCPSRGMTRSMKNITVDAETVKVKGASENVICRARIKFKGRCDLPPYADNPLRQGISAGRYGCVTPGQEIALCFLDYNLSAILPCKPCCISGMVKVSMRQHNGLRNNSLSLKGMLYPAPVKVYSCVNNDILLFLLTTKILHLAGVSVYIEVPFPVSEISTMPLS